MVLVSDFCAQLLLCTPKSLRDRLNHPEDRVRALDHLYGKKVRTTYKDRNGMRKTFFIGGLTERGAAFVPAYGRLRSPFNINVAAHFYARHRVKLHHPYTPCVIEGFKHGEDRYYPMELLEIIDDNKQGTFFGRFTEIIVDENSKKEDPNSSHCEENDDIDDGGRAECSQPLYHHW